MFVASHTPSSGTVATVTTNRGSAEPVRALLIKAASVNCPISLGVLATRNLTIERVDASGTVLASATYAMPNVGGSDRMLEFAIDVAIYPRAAVRAKMDYCSAGETQWVVINYDFGEG